MKGNDNITYILNKDKCKLDICILTQNIYKHLKKLKN